jgi:predicted nucleic acid-binding protein
VTTVADTGALYALYDADDAHHDAVSAAIDRERGVIIVPMAVLGELDYLLRELLGPDAELDFLDSLLSGAFVLEAMMELDVKRCRELLTQYRDLDLGLVDAAVMATAERLGTDRILTVDERDFRAVVSRSGKPFLLLPADARDPWP